MKKVSSGIVITDGDLILGCKATSRWDLPKGEMNEGEHPIEAALRETMEETGLILSKTDLTEIGFFEYTPYKNLWLFLYNPKILPCTKGMSCSTYFKHRSGRLLLEVTGYRYIPYSRIHNFFYPSICNVLEQIDFFKTQI